MSTVRGCVAAVAVWILAGSVASDIRADPSVSYVPSVAYVVRFPDFVHHEARISVVFTEVPTGRPFRVRMSRSSPGRYALHEFAKNVYAVTARDGAGNELEVERESPHEWNVLGPGSTVEVTYTLFADQIDGTFSAIDRTHAHLNMPASFMWAEGWEDAPIRISFERPVDAWRVATQLIPTPDPDVFTAPDLDYFMDSPVELSAFSMRTWKVSSSGRDIEYRIAVHHTGSDSEVDAFADNVRRLVEEHRKVFGEVPNYDTGTYTFILDLLPWADGDGMEHRNSTIITSATPLSPDGLANLGTTSHEFFHQWNVERIRPRALEPFSFTEENMSGELWFAEGFTSYYGDLLLRRAGLMSLDAYTQSLGETIDAVENAPGRRHRSAVEMSRQAPFVDRFAPRDRDNTTNTFISYYTWGSGIGLALDLTLRTQFGMTLDDLMRSMWETFGRQERPYALFDIERRLADVTGDADFAKTFFDAYVRGQEAPDFWELLDAAGLTVRAAAAGDAYMGGAFGNAADDRGAMVTTAPLEGSPLFEAGMDAGDLLLSVDGHEVTSADYVRAVLDLHRPGDSIHIRFEQRGRVVQADLELVQDPRVDVVTYGAIGQTPTPQMLRFRTSWLSGGGS